MRRVAFFVFLIAAAVAHAQTALKATSTVNVRSGPGTGYAILGQVPSGHVYVGISKSGEWWKIAYNGNTAWTHGAYYASLSGTTGVKVATDALNVRNGPGTGYSIIGKIYSGQIYFWTQYEGLGGWYKIYFAGGIGYCHGGYVAKVSLSGGSGARRYSPTAYELDIFERTVMAESGGEPYNGQVAVAAVILNRIASPSFPNTMHGVIFQPWQFSPATTGDIWYVTPSASVKQACQAALAWADPSYGALYFYSWCAISAPSWTYSKTWTTTIGCHAFYK